MSRIVVMGVSGCGKSSIGQALAKAVGAEFLDGDDLHPASNIEKMRRGEALNDDDRAPWLAKVGKALASGNRVIACSALKRKYRDQIRETAQAEVIFFYLRGQRETLLQRVARRPDHFMPASLLDSQLATLEEPLPDETHLVADIEQEPAAIVGLFLLGMKEMTP
jgi:carbohydrate kinase (thermoresistant glucokinase family)